MRLSEIAQSLENKHIRIRGRHVEIRAVTAKESEQVEAQNPYPQLKAIREEDRVTEAAHPGYVAKARRYMTVRRCILAAIAANLENAAGEWWTPERDRAWVEAFTDEMLSTLTEKEIGIIFQTQEDIEHQSIAEIVGDGETLGNS